MARAVAFLVALGAIIIAALLTTGISSAPTGTAEWPSMPHASPVGLAQSPVNAAETPAGIAQWAWAKPVLQPLVENAPSRRALAAAFLALFGLFVWLLAVGPRRRWDAYVMLLGGLAAGWAVVQPAQALLWLTEARMPALLGGALALGYVCVRNSGSGGAVGTGRRAAGIALLLPALLLAPVVAVLALPLAWLWPRFVLRTGTARESWRSRAPELALFLAATAWLIVAWLIAAPGAFVTRLLGWPLELGAVLSGSPPLRVAEVEPALLALGALGLVVLLLLAGFAWLRSRNPASLSPGLGLLGFAAVALLLGAVAGALDGRGVFVGGAWLALPAGVLVAALVRVLVQPLTEPSLAGHGTERARPAATVSVTAAGEPAGRFVGLAGMLLALAVLSGLTVTLLQHGNVRAQGGQALDLRAGSPRAASGSSEVAPLAYEQVAELSEAVQTARGRPLDYARGRLAWQRVSERTEATVAATDYLAALPEGEPWPLPGVDAQQVLLLHGEAQLAELTWAHRLWQGRIGGQLPMVLQMPEGYDIPKPEVYLPGARSEEESEPYDELYLRTLKRFASAWEAAQRLERRQEASEEVKERWVILFAGILYRLADELTEEIVDEASRVGRELAGWTRTETDEETGEQRTEAWRLPAVGLIPADEEDREPDVYIPVGEEPAEDEPEPVMWLLDRGILLRNLGERLKDLNPWPGQTADLAHLLWIGGHEEQALEMVTEGAEKAPDRDARALLEARIRFNRFSGHEQRDEMEEAREAWRAALEAVRVVRNLPRERYPNRRIRLDGLRHEALMWHFGPSNADRPRALDLYAQLERRNPPRALSEQERGRAEQRAERFALRFVPGTGEPDIRYLRGAYHLEKQQLERAAERYVEQLQRDPEHVLAQLDLGQMRYARAEASYRQLVADYTDTWRETLHTLTPEETKRFADFETLNPVPLWGLERVYADDEEFMSRLDEVARRVDLAHYTDPRNPEIRQLYHEFYYYRGDARLQRNEIDFAEMYMRQAFVAEENGKALIHGMPLADRLGRFYAEIWREMWDEVHFPESDAEPLDEDAEAVYDLLSRALKLSPEVRDQLYEFVTRVIGQNPDIDELNPNLRPFYVIAAELYPDWVPAQGWLGSWHDRQTRNEKLPVAERLAHWPKAEEHKLNALNELRREGREEFETMLLELAQFYGRWAAQQKELARVDEISEEEAARRLQRAADLYTTAYERAREFLRYGRSREMAWQTIAVLQHDRHRLAMMVGDRRAAAEFRDEAIDGYMMSVEPQSDDPNMAPLRSLMQLRIRLLSAAGAEEDRLIELVNEYERWVPNPLSTTLGVRDRILARRKQEEAIEALAENDPEAALEALEEALGRSTGDSELHLLFGQTAEELGETRLAMRHYHKALGTRPPQHLARYHLGLLYYEQDRPGEALVQLDRFLLWVEMVDDDEQGDVPLKVELAANDARSVAREIRDQSWDLLDEAYAAMAEENLDQAMERFKQAFEINRRATGIRGGYGPLLELFWRTERFRDLFRWGTIALRHDMSEENRVGYHYWRARASLALDVDELARLNLGFWKAENVSLGDWQLQRIIERWPDSEQAQTCRQLLEIRRQMRND